MNDYKLAKIVNEMISNISLLDNEIKLGIEEGGMINKVELAGNKYFFFSTRGLTPELKNFLDKISSLSSGLCTLKLESDEIEEAYIKRVLAITWLTDVHAKLLTKEEWNRLLDFLFETANRTHENIPNSINLIMNLTTKGDVALNDIKEKKIVDVLATTNYSFIEIDKSLKIIKYDYIDIGSISAKKTYSDVPDYLLPYCQYVGSSSGVTDKIGISLTRNGDILIYTNSELLLSIRKGNWTIYNNASLKNTLCDVIGYTLETAYPVACNLYDLIWNVSYRRHGALIVVTSANSCDCHIVNKESIMDNSMNPELRFCIKKDVAKIDLSKTGIIDGKPLLLELLSVDGATVIDVQDGKVRAFGAIVEHHPSVKNVSGARSTAAKSAVRHGDMKPIKISSDGDITFYKRIIDDTGKEHFLEFSFY